MPIRIEPFIRISIPLLTAATCLSMVGMASAQTQSIAVARVERDAATLHSQDEPYAIGIDDCRGDVVTKLLLTLPQRGYVSVYGGVDDQNCSDPGVRGTRGTDQCWDIIVDQYANEVSAPFPVDIPAKRMAGAAGDCDANTSRQVKLHIVLTDNGENVATTEWPNLVDLRPPEPPTDVKAGIGERSLEVNWATPNGETVTGYRLYCAHADASSTTTGTGGSGASSNKGATGGSSSGGASSGAGGASPSGTAASSGNAGSSGAAISFGNAGSSGTAASSGNAGSSGAAISSGNAGSSGTAASSGNAGASGAATSPEIVTPSSGQACFSSELVEGEPPGDGAIACGSVLGASQLSKTASGLENGIVWAVAVASVDETGNVSALSAPACQTPEELTDFFEAYSVNGRGGGGFCALSSRSASPMLGAGLLAAALALMTRRQRRVSRGSK